MDCGCGLGKAPGEDQKAPVDDRHVVASRSAVTGPVQGGAGDAGHAAGATVDRQEVRVVDVQVPVRAQDHGPRRGDVDGRTHADEAAAGADDRVVAHVLGGGAV